MSVLSTKAQTLESISKVISGASVLPLVRFCVNDFYKNCSDVVNRIQDSFAEDSLIIRSSSKVEDTSLASHAGHYISILNVSRDDAEQIEDGVKKVITSYGHLDEDDEILVQPMLKDISMAGVVFTADLDTLAPYYILNYDTSGSTDSVTSGHGKNLKTYVRFKGATTTCPDPLFQKIFEVCEQLENVTCNPCLDIEFAFNSKSELYIFQVRPIVQTGKVHWDRSEIGIWLNKIYKKLDKFSDPSDSLCGDHIYYGVMPDWNPAEIIGVRPRALALSLYQELVTDKVWAYQRHNYGYRDLRSFPLIVSFLGIPYVDIRASMNSFIPKALSEATANKLVQYYLSKLNDNPELHDKMEFDIVYSCYFLNLPNTLDCLIDHGFDRCEIEEIIKALRDVTNGIVDPDDGLFIRDMKKIDILKSKYEKVVSSDSPLIDRIYWLIEDCKRYGTLPFAGIARSAFIAMQLLRSFVDVGILSKADYQQFLNSLSTITRQMNGDLKKVFAGEIMQDDFLQKYGHLRPGTYDVRSLRYDENFENYFAQSLDEVGDECNEISFTLSGQQHSALNEVLKLSGLDIDSKELCAFIKNAIEGREYAKFIFTRSLSEVLKLVSQLGGTYGISRDDISHLDILTVTRLYHNLDHRDLNDILQADIDRNSRYFKLTEVIKLPHLILERDDIYHFYLPEGEPNYITLNSVEAEIVLEDDISKGIEDKIVFIESADPGYDWIFNKHPSGLVTMYGGCNSHMAIRCAELGLPAVIGVGEKNFKKWGMAQRIHIDCENNRITVIR